MKYEIQEDSFMAPLPRETPEEKLLAAVLLRAWKDVLDPRTKDEAVAWFSERGPWQENTYLSYLQVCAMLDLDPERLWAKIQQVVDLEYVGADIGENPPGGGASLGEGPRRLYA